MNHKITSVANEITTEKPHWSYYQTNGKSPEENFFLQKQELYKSLLLQKQEGLFVEQSEALTNVKLTIKSEVK